MTDRTELRAAFRVDGWSVAVHNDYRLNGEPMTFWLFTHPDGRYAKGEGATDAEAISAAWFARAARVPSGGTGLTDLDREDLLHAADATEAFGIKGRAERIRLLVSRLTGPTP